MTHEEMIAWMKVWCREKGLTLALEGEIGFGRECVGVLDGGSYPEYEWFDADYNRADSNGEVWTPEDAYHKGPYVAVLGRGKRADMQLYEWLRWFDENEFELERGTASMPVLSGSAHRLSTLMGDFSFARMVRKGTATS